MIHIPSDGWLIPLAILLVAMAVGIFWLYRNNPAGKQTPVLSYILKGTAILLLLLCLLDPQIVSKEPRKGETGFIVLADNSSSMKLKTPDSKKSQAEVLAEVIKNGKTGWLHDLDEQFDLTRYAFSHRLSQFNDEKKFDFSGNATDLMKHLQDISQRYDKNKTGGILLLTDGLFTDREKSEIDFSRLPAVFPVILRDNKDIKDLWVKDVSATVSSFEDAPVSLKVDIGNRNYSGEEIEVEIIDDEHKVIASKKYSQDGDFKTLRFQIRDQKTGIQFYNVRVSATAEKEQFKNEGLRKEITLKNNVYRLKVDRRGGPYRILYVGGRPNWDYKFLARSIEEEKHLELSALIRIARKEKKFNFREGKNADVNPLFQGLDKEKAEANESYDEPVFLRFNTKNKEELAKGFPSTKEELFKYHAVIIDDCESGFFTSGQQALLRDFVSERGGGLLMLGGMESLFEGRYQKTVMRDILPVYLNISNEMFASKKRFSFSLSRDGWLQPWVRLFENESEEKKRMASMADFRVLNRTSGVKPGARVLAEVSEKSGKKLPALIVQRFGLGRTAVFTIGDYWRWGMKSVEDQVLMSKSWRQMMRWLAADVPSFMEMNVKSPETPGEPVEIEFKPRDKDFKPLEEIDPKVEVVALDGSIDTKSMTQDEKNPGIYRLKYYPPGHGNYTVRINAGAELPEKGEQVNRFYVTDQTKEDRVILPDDEFLKELADKTGGRMVTIDELEDFSENIPEESFKFVDEKSEPIWNRAWVFMAIILLLSAEWWIRRTKGMP